MVSLNLHGFVSFSIYEEGTFGIVSLSLNGLTSISVVSIGIESVSEGVVAEGFLGAVLMYAEGTLGIVSLNLVIFTESKDIESNDRLMD